MKKNHMSWTQLITLLILAYCSILKAQTALPELPALKERLDTYIEARRMAFGELKLKYVTALESQIELAADAGDIQTASALLEEKNIIDSVAKNWESDPVSLEELDDQTVLPPLKNVNVPALVKLRRAWEAAHDQLRVRLDRKLDVALKSLEVQLTRERKFEDAKLVLSCRESYFGKEAIATAQPELPESSVMPLTKAEREHPFVNSLGMKFVPVPGTQVLICVHETRRVDYGPFAQETLPNTAWKAPSKQGVMQSQHDDYPVVNVSWHDAKAFCDWLSKKEGLTYRLPTDREWSYAVGIGKEEDRYTAANPSELSLKVKDEYPWGNGWPPDSRDGSYAGATARATFGERQAIIHGFDDGFAMTSPVMHFKPNGLGIYDLGGNVWEWCEEWFDAAKTLKVKRGASYFNHDQSYLNSSFRHGNEAEHREPGGGFRLVLVLPK